MPEHIQKGLTEVNGTTLYYEMMGEGPPLVLNHGVLVDHHLWDGHSAALARHFTVINYDIRGYGISGLITHDTAPYSREHDLYCLLQFLGIEHASLLGLSMGGALAIDFTLQHPQMVDALITVGAAVSGFHWEEVTPATLQALDDAAYAAFRRGEVERSIELLLQTWTDGPGRTPQQIDPNAREQVRAMTTRNFARHDVDNVWTRQPLELVPPAIGRLSEIHVPTLILVGSHDVLPIQVIADLLEQGIAGARKVVIPEAAHHLPLEQPDLFTQVVIEFLEQLR